MANPWLLSISLLLAVVGAMAYVVSALWLASRPAVRMAVILPSRWWLAAAAGAMALWAAAWVMAGPDSFTVVAATAVRNAALIAWLAAAFLRGAKGETGMSMLAVKLIVTTLVCISLITAAFSMMAAAQSALTATILSPQLFLPAATSVEMLVAAGGLVLVDQLLRHRAAMVRMPLIAVAGGCAALWAYTLNILLISFLSGRPANMLIYLEPLVLLLMVPTFLMAAMDTGRERIRLSRSIAFRAIAMLCVCIYLILIALTGAAARMIGGDYGALSQGLFLGLSLMLGALLLLLPQARAWLSVMIAKNFFEHRYDYRAEWMRFTATIGQTSAADENLETRVARAICALTSSPGGLVLTANYAGDFTVTGQWRWPTAANDGRVMTASQCAPLHAHGHIIDMTQLRAGRDAVARGWDLPSWLLDDPQVWAAVPMQYDQRLVGIAVLRQPPAPRRLDWEDLDVLRIAGQQAASHIAETQTQTALSESRRFDEFNRRFAFIMHDVKNLASQLGLLAANAERHADNPEFRADMLATLRLSSGRMQDLLVRLSPAQRVTESAPEPVDLGLMLPPIAQRSAGSRPLDLSVDADAMVFGQPQKIAQIVDHLLANAYDASAPGTPVALAVRRVGDVVAVSVSDQGCGMTADFIRDELFKPFVSTKRDGFGLGAFEALQLAQSMRGQLRVDSTPGQGSRFTLTLPAAAQHQQEDAA